MTNQAIATSEISLGNPGDEFRTFSNGAGPYRVSFGADGQVTGIENHWHPELSLKIRYDEFGTITAIEDSCQVIVQIEADGTYLLSLNCRELPQRLTDLKVHANGEIEYTRSDRLSFRLIPNFGFETFRIKREFQI